MMAGMMLAESLMLALYIVCLAYYYTPVLGSAHDTSLTISPNPALPGENVVVTCKLPADSNKYTNKWLYQKGYLGSVGDKKIVAPKYESDETLRIGKCGTDTYCLYIVPVGPQHGGQYACGPSMNESAMQTLTIVRPPEELKMDDCRGNVLKPSSNYSVAVGQDYCLRMMANGSNPCADLEIFIGSENITPRFKREETTSGQGCNATMTTEKPLLMKEIYLGKSLGCTAIVPRLKPMKISTFIEANTGSQVTVKFWMMVVSPLLAVSVKLLGLLKIKSIQQFILEHHEVINESYMN